MLDTNICIHIIRKNPPELIQKLSQYPASEVCISTITAAELQFGVQKSNQPNQNQQALDRFLAAITIADFDYKAAKVYGHVRTYLEAQGKPIGAHDALIAAHALSRNLILVTNNTKEFSRVPELEIEDWISQ